MRVNQAIAVLVFFAGSAFSPASAATFFGEDLGLGEDTRLTGFPNAAAARAQFNSNLSGVGTESFEGFEEGSFAPLDLSFAGSTGTITASLGSGSGTVVSLSSGTNGFGRYPTDGSNYFETSSSNFTVSFGTPVAAFGFDGIDVGDFDGQVTVTLEQLGGGSRTYNVGNTINGLGGSVLFWGLIDTENLFTSVTFGNTNFGTDVFAFDSMTIGDAGQVCLVPVPATLPLIFSGLLGMLALKRRKLA